MEGQRIWIKVILLVAVLFLSAFFSAAVTALSSLRRIHVGGENNKKDSKEEQLLRLWLKNPNELLTTLLFGKTVAYIFLIGMSILLFKDYYKIFELSVGFAAYDIIVFVIMSIFVLIFVEMIPIIYAKSNVYKISKAIIVPLDTARIILRPFILIFIQISKFILGLFKVKLEERIFEMTEEDIKTFVKAGTEEGIIEEEEEEMIHSIFEFSDTTVKEILTPRTSVFALDSEKTLGEVWDEIVEQGFSRIPVYNENIDKIEGIVTSFYPDGKIAQTVNYINGKREGELIEYYENGQIKEKRFYVNDKEEGKSLFYDEKGKLIKTEVYKNGIKQ